MCRPRSRRTASARADRAEKVLLRPGCRQNDDLAARIGGSEPWQRREAVEPGHRQVEEHEVRLEPLRELVASRDHREADEIVYVVTGPVTEQAARFGTENRIRLMQGEDLAKLLDIRR